MFKKYFAHEFKNSCQMPLTICGLIVGVCLLVGIGALLKLEFLYELGLIALGVSVYACLIMSYISIHKTITGRLFSKSGYLTLTLPVGTHTILISKILVNIVYVLFYVISMIVGLFILLFGFGKFVDVGSIFDGFDVIFKDMIDHFDVGLIELFYSILSFVFFLCIILFCEAFKNSGFLKKQSKVLNFLVLVVFIILLAFVMSFEIIPYILCFDDINGKYLIIHTNDYDYKYSSLVDFSTLFWLLLGTTGFYFGSYYLIKNKIDII